MVVVFAGVACSSDGGPGAGPSASPSPTRVQAEPVEGEVEVEVFDTSSSPVLRGGSGQEPDQEKVDALVEQLVSWLDDHLHDLQRGGQGDLEAVAADGLLDGADASTLAAVTSRLTSSDRPVDVAKYHVQIAHRGGPEWARVVAKVTGHDGQTRQAHFTFEVTDAQPLLVAAGPSLDDPVEDEQRDDGEEVDS